MVKKQIKVGDIPAILCGQPSEGVYLYVHGQHSCKEAAESFAEVVNGKGWQVLAMDLPEHGERKSEENAFYAWNVVPELRVLLKYARERWGHVSLRAHSIGAYFSMMSYQREHFENVQLVSPILDMQKLCEDMMKWAGVSPAELEEKRFIKTGFGQTLCWQEYCYAKAILTALASKAMSRGYEIIMLNASDMGRALYKKMGFTDIHNGMILDMRKRKIED